MQRQFILTSPVPNIYGRVPWAALDQSENPRGEPCEREDCDGASTQNDTQCLFLVHGQSAVQFASRATEFVQRDVGLGCVDAKLEVVKVGEVTCLWSTRRISLGVVDHQRVCCNHKRQICSLCELASIPNHGLRLLGGLVGGYGIRLTVDGVCGDDINIVWCIAKTGVVPDKSGLLADCKEGHSINRGWSDHGNTSRR